MKRTKVLHISLAHGGGVISALNSYIINSSEVDHYLVVLNDEKFNIAIETPSNLIRTFSISYGLSGLFCLYNIFFKIKPDFIHMHSSFAGFFGRIMFPFFPNLIYTPHCFSFERKDVSKLKVSIFYLAEKLLSLIPVTYAGCAPREVFLAKKIALKIFKQRNCFIFLPNYSDINECWISTDKKEKIVTMVGRLCPQKDPVFFVNTSKIVKNYDAKIKFHWLGNGENDCLDYLKQNDVSCSGWLTRNQLISELFHSDLYFHSAAWEGNPMSVLEVSKMQIPIVARKIPSLDSIGLTNSSATPEGCAELIIKHFNGDNSQSNKQFLKINSICSVENQVAALKSLYFSSENKLV